MTEKELQHMGRRELIEIIAAQKKRELELEQQLQAANQQLADRNIKLSEAGSIAEAALSLNGIFETAQAAADNYIESIHAANADIEAQIAQTNEECARLREETKRECAEKLEATEAEIMKRTAVFNKKIKDFLQAHPELDKTGKNEE